MLAAFQKATRTTILFVFATALIPLPTILAEVHWQVVFLHPEGGRNSQALAAAGSRQGGTMEIGIFDHPVLWSRRADSILDLLAEGSNAGSVMGMDGATQVGETTDDLYIAHAWLWKGKAEDYIDLTPGYPYGAAYATDVSRGQQVGYASSRQDGHTHAILWFGAPDTYVDLHPSGARDSTASATDGEFQGGGAYILQPRQNHAALWHGSSASFVDMNPLGATSSSIVGMSPGIQVGTARFGSYYHAVLWRGTPESVVDLHPANVFSSRAYATTGTIHVGYIAPRSDAEAGFWTGDDPNSFFNLQALLPPGWSRSLAQAVSVVGPRIYIAGAALAPEGNAQALLWIGTTIETKDANRAPTPEP